MVLRTKHPHPSFSHRFVLINVLANGSRFSASIACSLIVVIAASDSIFDRVLPALHISSTNCFIFNAALDVVVRFTFHHRVYGSGYYRPIKL